MEFLVSKPNMGYYLVRKAGKYYFVFDLYDKPEFLHMYEVDDDDVVYIINHNGDGLSLDQKLMQKHEFDKVIDRKEFVDNNNFSFRSR